MPPCGGLEPARPVLERAGERAFDVAEELALVKLPGNGSAIDADQRPLAAPAVLVNFAGDQFLARAGFAQDQHRGVGSRHHFHLAQQPLQGRALADHFAQRLGFLDLLLKKRVLQFQMRLELLDFLESARVDDGGGDMIGEDPQPGGGLIRGRNAVELRDHAQDFVLKNNRLRRRIRESPGGSPIPARRIRPLPRPGCC